VSQDAIAALERGARDTPRAATIELLSVALKLSDAERADFHAAARSSTAVPAVDTPPPAPDAKPPGVARWRRGGWVPLQPTPLVGRSAEVETILRLLTVEGVRLLTLVGPAGVGKTRLALAATADAQLADRFSDGVILVDLAPIRAPQDVLGAVGRACGFTDSGQLPLGERLRDFLQERATLLVLDNFEQALPAAALLSDLLARCPDLALLVTSRAPLHVRWEHTLRVAPLAVPDLSVALPSLAELTAIPSVTLFLQRARSRRAHFALSEQQTPLLAQLVAQLDGLPLALELAAARLDVLSLPTLTRRLADRLQLLAVDAPDLPERQRSLEAAVGWSYDLLSEREQRLFRCLGVFVGRVTLDAIATVDRVVGTNRAEARGAEGGDERETGHTLRRLLSLAEKSLLLPPRPEESNGQEAFATESEEPEDNLEDDLEPAFGMLETVREYAEAQLVAHGVFEAAKRAHAHYFLALAEQAALQLNGRDQRAWYLRLEREHDNVRVALRWLLDQDAEGEREVGLRLARALGFFWFMRGYHAEGLSWLEEALTKAPQANPSMRAHALIYAGRLFVQQHALERAQEALEEALALAEQREDGVAAVEALTYLGGRALYAGDMAESARLLHEALRRGQELGDHVSIGRTLFWLGATILEEGGVTEAAALEEEALKHLEAAGQIRAAGSVHCGLAVVRGRLGDLLSAVEHVRTALKISAALRDRWLLRMSVCAALSFSGGRGDPAQRALLLGVASAQFETGGAAPGLFELRLEDQDTSTLREQLGQEAWDTALRAGRALRLEEVAALALTLMDEVAQPLIQARARPLEHAGRSVGSLTTRELEVLGLVAQGLSSKVIGRRLFIATSTVNYHLTSVFNKLGVDTRAQAVAVAAQRGLL
jgi:non-specific serine/threonine protein kinase